MTELLKLRDYQDEAITKTFEAIALGTNRPAVVLPTGAGKTVIFSWMANKWIQDGNRSRVLILVHRDELVKQTVKKLNDVAPGLRVGVVKADRNEHGMVDVIVASVQTLRMPKRHQQIVNVGLVIVDEAHHAAAESYRTVLDYFGCFTGLIPAIGFSATLSRSDKADLSRVWDRVVYQKDILDMIPKYLCDVRGKLVTVDGLSLADVARNNGDLAAGSLSEALLTADAMSFVVRAFFEHAAERKTIVFTPTVAAMEAFVAAFRAAGVATGSVWGAQDDDDRASNLLDFKTGRIQVLVNVMVLTEGYDEPSASCAIICRPTESEGLYVQMVGRVLRLFPGKIDALVLDVVGASLNNRLATLADLTEREIKEIREGETLATAAIREKKEGNTSFAGLSITMKDVDLFHRSPSAWLRTKAGVYFISTRCQASMGCRVVPGTGKCGNHLWFLWPEDGGTFKIGVRGTFKSGGRYAREGLDLAAAMAWAEQLATDEDSSIATRAASWRKKKGPPSDAQRDYALSLGIAFTEKTTKPELSDLMSIHIASTKLDAPYVKLMKETVPA